MARWSETRGYTLILRQPRGPDQFARVALVRKRTLLGSAFNVREARAEDLDGEGGEDPEALGGLGRLLSWRWLGESEASELLSARLRTLEALGYEVMTERGQTRGPWDWLRDLVQRQLSRPNPSDDAQARQWSEPHTTHTPQGAAAALREALERLGLQPAALLEGIATIIDLDVAELREPSPASLAKLDVELFAMLLPFFVEHESSELREVGRRWLDLPNAIYEFDRELIESWLIQAGTLARALLVRLDREALALLGPEGIARVAHRAREAEVRARVERWRSRLAA
ncbi:hypothetical protein ACNOYE_12100 [Nannocystaceae bacterium ST9]